MGTGLYAELNPVKVSDNWNYGLTVTGPKYATPFLQEAKESTAIFANSVLGLGKTAYDAAGSMSDAFFSSNNSAAAGGYLDLPEQAEYQHDEECVPQMKGQES